ncbi:hypothetical protein F4678DRAFT_482652 [Xylaria arbuscula]|nr:hypothetical protein F4678DRAFT_482652 [Xylaria arbuscula]
MVGIAGKSQACNTCRERSVRAKRGCTGYERGEWVFVNRSLSSPSTSALEILSRRSYQYQPPTINIAKESDILYHLFTESKYAVELLETSYLPRQRCLHNESGRQGSFSWVYGLADLDKPSRSLDTALFAFCLMQLHVTLRAKADASLHDSLHIYNAALQRLFVSPRPNAWSIHIRGINELLRLRQPGMTDSLAWCHLTPRMRLLCMLEALTRRQGQILLDNGIWRQITHHSGLYGALDEVCHLIADTPTMLGKGATLSFIHDQDITLKESAVVVCDMLVMVNTIEAWRHEFLRASPTDRPRYWLVPSAAKSPADIDDIGVESRIFPSHFEFESLDVGAAIIIVDHHYHMAFDNFRAQANYSNQSGLNISRVSLVAAATVNQKDLSINEVTSKGTDMAQYVCQSLEYFHRTEMGTARQYFRLHPGHKHELKWLQSIQDMNGPDTHWGLSIMTFTDVAEPLHNTFVPNRRG